MLDTRKAKHSKPFQVHEILGSSVQVKSEKIALNLPQSLLEHSLTHSRNKYWLFKALSQVYVIHINRQYLHVFSN
jgi:hypothetical protein